MDPLYVFALGPLDEDGTLLHVGWHDDEILPVEPGADPTSALRELSGQVPKGTPLQCSEDYADVAARAGFQVTEPSEEVVAVRATLAVSLVQGPDGEAADPGLCTEILDASLDLVDGEGLEGAPPVLLFQATLGGAVQGRREVVVLNPAAVEHEETDEEDEDHDLPSLLVFEKGARKFVKALEDGDERTVASAEVLSLQFVDDPLASAVEAATGLPFVPLVTFVRAGQPKPWTVDDARLVCALARAIGELGGDGETRVDVEDVEVDVRLERLA